MIISYDLRWRPICPPTGACIKPQVTATLSFVFNPSRTGRLTLPVNPNTYRLEFIRKETIERNEGLQIVFESASSSDEGNCTNGIARKLNRIVFDSANNVRPIYSVTRDYFDLREGTYECHITAPVFNVGMSSIALNAVSPGDLIYRNEAGVTSDKIYGDTVDSTGISALNTLDATLTVSDTNAGTTAAWVRIEVLQYCSAPAGIDEDLGRHFNLTGAPSYKNVYTNIQCLRVE